MNKIWVILLVPIVISSCAVNSSYVGGSSRDTKNRTLNSLIFLTADVLYPNGMRENFLDPPENPSATKLRRLHTQLDELLAQVVARHDSRAETLSQHLGYSVQPLPDFSIKLTNTWQPLIHTDIGGEIVIDLRVMHALFLSTIAGGLADEWNLGDLFVKRTYDFETMADSAESAEVEAALDEFFLLRRKIEQTAGLPAVLDFAEMFFVNTVSDWQSSKLSDYASITAETEERLLGSILFLLAHEVGHHAAGHFSLRQAEIDQKLFTSMELQADRYAAVLIADAWDEEGTFGRQERVTLDMRGNELFFRLGEELVGFQEGPNREGLSYPSSTERLSITSELYDKVLVARRKELGYRLINTWWGKQYWTKSAEPAEVSE